MFSPYLRNISINTYVGSIKPISNGSGWSVDADRYHICHGLVVGNSEFGLTFVSDLTDFNHRAKNGFQ